MLTKFSMSIQRCLSLIALLMLTPGHAQVLLVTESEALADRQAPVRPTLKSPTAPDAPRIEIREPQIGNPLDSPVRIDVRFVAVDPARIQPETFKVRYGSLRLDITARLRGAATISPQGIAVPQAVLPRGWHRLHLEIRDTQDRLGTQTVEFEIR